MRIVFTGGATLGSVMPLLTIARSCQQHGISQKSEMAWIGTVSGPEKKIVSQQGLVFFGIAAGKLRKYFDFRNFFDPLLCGIGCFQSLILLIRFRPSLIIHAGSFVGVPVCWVGWLLGIRVLVLQMDIVPSLSNILVRHCAWRFCVSCPKAARRFGETKTILTGIPVRHEIEEVVHHIKDHGYINSQKKLLGISPDRPVVLVLGGGTGSADLNMLVWDSLSLLTQHATIIHSVGKSKQPSHPIQNPHYRMYEFITDDLVVMLAVADIVVTRAGMGVLSELSVLGKPSIIIPLPASHQEHNASYVQECGAAKYCHQNMLTSEKFAKEIRDLLSDDEQKKKYSQNIKNIFPHNATQNIIDIISPT